MPAPILVIGSGGSGMAILLQLKERLIEMYGEIPASVAFLQIDIQKPQSSDEFHGIHLEAQEYISLIDSHHDLENDSTTLADEKTKHDLKNDSTMSVDEKTKIEIIYENHAKEDLGWDWVDTNRLEISLIGAADRTIVGGSKQCRPLGRAALFLCNQVLRKRLQTILTKLILQSHHASSYQKEITEQDLAIKNHSEQKRLNIGQILVFIVGSIAGGMGAGTLLDLGLLVRQVAGGIDGIDRNLYCIGTLIGPRIFTSNWDGQLSRTGNNTNRGQETLGLYSNAYAFLRETDRLCVQRAYTKFEISLMPQVTYPDSLLTDPVSLKTLVFDDVFVFDTRNRLNRSLAGMSDQYVTARNDVVFPAVADFIAAHVDNRIALHLAVHRTNWSNIFKGQYERQFSSAGIYTWIFPREDVRKAVGLRLLEQVVSNYLVAEDAVLNQNSQLLPGTRHMNAVPEIARKKRQAEGKFLTPKEFVDFQFSSQTIASDNREGGEGDIGNHTFIRNAVLLANDSEQALPIRQTDVEAILKLVVSDTEAESQIVKLAQMFTRSFREYENHSKINEDQKKFEKINEWVQTYIGLGDIGNESGSFDQKGIWYGRWDAILGEFQKPYKVQFERVIDRTLMALLNEREVQEGEQMGRLKANRLEFTIRVLNELELLIGEFNRRVQRAFGEQDTQHQDLVERVMSLNILCVQGIERKIIGIPLGSYVGDYVKERRKLAEVQMYRRLKRVLEQLAELLTGVIRDAKKALLSWRETLRSVLNELRKEGNFHTERRKRKDAILVRRYLPQGEARSRLEKRLERDYRDKTLEALLGNFQRGNGIEWTRGIIDNQNTDKKETQAFFYVWTNHQEMNGHGAADIAKALMRWAFSDRGSFLGEMGNPQEVDMAQLIWEEVDADTQHSSTRLATSFLEHEATYALLETQASLKIKGERYLCLPTVPTAQGLAEVQADAKAREHFFDEFLTYYNSKTGDYQNQTDPVRQPDAPTVAFVMEMLHGLVVDDLEIFNAAAPSYWYDVFPQPPHAYGKGLHLFREESEAAQIEWQFEEPRKALQLERTRLSPYIVDLLGCESLDDEKHPVKMERTFALALAFGLVGHSQVGTTKQTFLSPVPLRVGMNLDEAFQLTKVQENDFGAILDAELQGQLRILWALRSACLGGMDQRDPKRTFTAGDVQRWWLNAARRGAQEIDSEAVAYLEHFRDETVVAYLRSEDARIRDMGKIFYVALTTQAQQIRFHHESQGIDVIGQRWSLAPALNGNSTPYKVEKPVFGSPVSQPVDSSLPSQLLELTLSIRRLIGELEDLQDEERAGGKVAEDISDIMEKLAKKRREVRLAYTELKIEAKDKEKLFNEIDAVISSKK